MGKNGILRSKSIRIYTVMQNIIRLLSHLQLARKSIHFYLIPFPIFKAKVQRNKCHRFFFHQEDEKDDFIKLVKFKFDKTISS